MGSFSNPISQNTQWYQSCITLFLCQDILKSKKQQNNCNFARLQFSRFILLFVNSTILSFTKYILPIHKGIACANIMWQTGSETWAYSGHTRWCYERHNLTLCQHVQNLSNGFKHRHFLSSKLGQMNENFIFWVLRTGNPIQQFCMLKIFDMNRVTHCKFRKHDI